MLEHAQSTRLEYQHLYKQTQTKEVTSRKRVQLNSTNTTQHIHAQRGAPSIASPCDSFLHTPAKAQKLETDKSFSQRLTFNWKNTDKESLLKLKVDHCERLWRNI